jgi:nucleotide-binding universal stress UspA family protein
MSKELKFLYETNVKQQAEEKILVPAKDSEGKAVEISKTIKKGKPIKMALIKPNRKLFEGAEIYYAKQLSDFIRAGLLPYSLVAKRYANDGGPLTEEEKKYLEKLKKESEELQLKFFQLVGEGEEKAQERNQLLVSINEINTQVNNIQNAYSSIYENTAEYKARDKVIEWWVLQITYIDENGDGYKPLFGEGELDQKLEKYDEISDRENPFYNEVMKKSSYLVSFWFAARANLSKIDLESMDKLYTETISDYQIEEDKAEEPAAAEAPVETPK